MKLVTVAAYPQAHQAHLARTLLNDVDILAFVEGDYGSLFPGDGGIKVRVPDHDADAARAVLEAAHGASSPDPE